MDTIRIGVGLCVIAVTALTGTAYSRPAISLTDRAGEFRIAADDPCEKGGYGVADCPNYSNRRNDDAAKAAKDSSNQKSNCQKGGYGVADCPDYSSKSSSGESTTDEKAAKKLQGCGGYGANDCPNSGH